METLAGSPNVYFFAITVLLLLGCTWLLITLLKQSKKLASAVSDYEQSNRQLMLLTEKHQAREQELRAAQQELQGLKITEGQLQERLNAAKFVEQQLSTERANLNDKITQYEAQLAQWQQNHHNTEKQLQTSLAEKKSVEAQVVELQQRHNETLKEQREARDVINQLKDALATEGKKLRAIESREEEISKQITEYKNAVLQAQEKYDALLGKYQHLQSQYDKLATEQSEREASHKRELENFEKQKNSLAEQFKLLSNEILDAKTKALQENSKISLHAVMNPFQQSIDSFKKEVQEIHHRDSEQQGLLRKELQQLKELNQKITTEAHELSTALRGQKKLQGNWGELVLENVLDRSGLQLGKDYQREVSIKTEEGKRRPDVIVYLPQDKHLIIDAKVSLNAYTRFVNAEDDLERAQALKEHVQAVGDRIKELADRDYYKLPGLNSPEMVFMFIPIESAFVEALKSDETLFQQAIENNVLVATPTTLLTSLNIVRQLWRYEDQNKHTAALANKAEGVFKKLNTFLASFEKIKKGIDTAAEAYSKAENQLISGKGNLVKQVGEFKNLAPAIKAELPSYFVEKAELEVDFIAVDESLEETEDSKKPLAIENPKVNALASKDSNNQDMFGEEQ
ncbi:hypothetical protein MAH1_21360 [Sessilibacter sp. MAH1]